MTVDLLYLHNPPLNCHLGDRRNLGAEADLLHRLNPPLPVISTIGEISGAEACKYWQSDSFS